MKKLLKYTIETDNKDFLFTLALLPVTAWLLMLVSGALAHRLNIPVLSKIGYLDALLINLAYKFMTGPHFTKQSIFYPENEELK